jgi:adenylate kinase
LRNRLHVYEEQTAPLISVYEARGLLVKVDGLGEIAEVTKRITDALDSKIQN